MTGESSSTETPDPNAPSTPGAAAQFYYEKSIAKDTFQAEDPDPLPKNAEKKRKGSVIGESKRLFIRDLRRI